MPYSSGTLEWIDDTVSHFGLVIKKVAKTSIKDTKKHRNPSKFVPHSLFGCFLTSPTLLSLRWLPINIGSIDLALLMLL